jgi:hypothetical protein
VIPAANNSFDFKMDSWRQMTAALG